MPVNIQTTISPYTQEPICTRPLLSPSELDTVISEAVKAQKSWKKVPLDERLAIAEKWLVEFEGMTDLLAEDIAIQMGRPISSCKGEIGGHSIAQDISSRLPRIPLGVIGTIVPWNYPHLCIVNSVLPGLIAGNAVIIKPAPQTPLPAERVLSTWTAAGLPANVLQVVHLDQESTLNKFVADPRIDFVSFTGSVVGGRAVQEAAAKGKGFKGVGLELGGKDPAYVRQDADLKFTVENLVDGAMFNSGQSCCAVERIYVHSAIYDEFVKQFVELSKAYKLGDPLKPDTTLGPVISVASAARIRKQVKDAVAAGAQLVLDESAFPGAKEGTTLVGPQVLTNVDHTMEIMMEETFGPTIGIMKVESDDEALALMNDSPYGLTASIWTSPSDPSSLAVFNHFVEELECGTVYLNRADALDPAVPWSGWKDSGRGVSLSHLGYDQLTRSKAVMMRVKLD
ncbi:hypothetical protein EHS25_007802 [Saitozyma podzolica]|uniref:Aldehyde dehydrogenase domain-containing protein n=1 Tax=Saitozyma podzolica TaxID=1890683 RepID=A0A427YQY0_9TREE|nr:hypothetical protein EHS25_007802 [Saitozyma podzolica]